MTIYSASSISYSFFSSSLSPSRPLTLPVALPKSSPYLVLQVCQVPSRISSRHPPRCRVYYQDKKGSSLDLSPDRVPCTKYLFPFRSIATWSHVRLPSKHQSPNSPKTQ